MLNQKEEKIMQIVRMSGPILPSVVAKSIETEVYLASAMLSVLVNNGHLKLSHRPVGSSPLYFVPGQEKMVRERLHKELSELEKKSLKRIEELRIAFPNDLFPQERVLLSGMKDFVEKLTLKIGNQELDIWKHYSVSDEELNKKIEEKFSEKEQEPETEPEVPVIETLEKIQEPQREQEPKAEPKVKEKPKKKRVSSKAPSEFEKKIEDYLKEKGVEIILTHQIGKGESIYDVIVQTPLGPQNFLVKAKKKNIVNESDVSAFYAECMHHKKPGIFFASKPLNKKTQEFISKNIGGLIRVIVL